MSPLRRKARDMLERFMKRFYEGPAAPERYADTVKLFRMLNPTATADAWEDFATKLAEGAYQDGYVRGYEWTERDLDSKPKHDPDVLAEMYRFNYGPSDDPAAKILLERGDPNDPMNGIPPELRLQFLQQIGGSTFVHAPSDDEDDEDDAGDEPE